MSSKPTCQRCSNEIPWFIHNTAKYCPPCHKIVVVEPRRCRDCQTILNDPRAPSYATRCRECYDKSRYPTLISTPPSYPKRCKECLAEIPEHFRQLICYACMTKDVPSPAKSPVPVIQCDQCEQELQDADHPPTLNTCYTCMGRKACQRICQDCEQLIELDVPSKSTRCYACIGRSHYTKVGTQL